VPFFVLAWFLYVQTGQFILEPPYVQPPQVAHVFDGEKDKLEIRCAEAVAVLKKIKVKAFCEEVL
jgi:hypothetical protein